MPTIIVTAQATHPMIPPYREAAEKIKKLTGLDARPKASGVQATGPFILEVDGTWETAQTLKANGFEVRFA